MNYKIGLYLFFTLISCYSCKSQLKHEIPVEKTQKQDKPSDSVGFLIDEEYTVADYNGMQFPDYYFKVVSYNKYMPNNHYLLLYDLNNNISDTLNITDKDVSVNVTFKNNTSGVALGTVQAEDLNNIRFNITDLYEIKNLKFKQLTTQNPEIKNCEIPIQFQSEEYAGIEDYFTYYFPSSNSEFLIDESKEKLIPEKQSDSWNGVYFLNLEDLQRMGETHSISYKVIVNGGDVELETKLDNNPVKRRKGKVKDSNESEIQLTIDGQEFMLSKSQGGIYLSGHEIYLINPPNEMYVVEKIK